MLNKSSQIPIALSYLHCQELMFSSFSEGILKLLSCICKVTNTFYIINKFQRKKIYENVMVECPLIFCFVNRPYILATCWGLEPPSVHSSLMLAQYIRLKVRGQSQWWKQNSHLYILKHLVRIHKKSWTGSKVRPGPSGISFYQKWTFQFLISISS